MEVKIFLKASCCKSRLNVVDFGLGLLVAEGIGEGEESRLAGRIAEHVGEPEDELVFVVYEVVHFREYAPPLLLRVGKHAEHWLEALAVELRLHVQILKCEGQLLSLRHAMD